jgi:hypothetical protein
MEVTRLLSAQVAISIENALLYASLEDKVKVRTAELEEANGQIVSLNIEKQKRQEIEMAEKLALIAGGRSSFAPYPRLFSRCGRECSPFRSWALSTRGDPRRIGDHHRLRGNRGDSEPTRRERECRCSGRG